MKRILACLATVAFAAFASAAAAQSQDSDPIGDLISATSQPAADAAGRLNLRATLYHAGRRMNSRDSLGCRVSPMRTLAVDPSVIARHSIVYIKETAGMILPDGSVHDGYWYASDIGGAIKGDRIDLFTGDGAQSMRPLEALNLKLLTVSKVGEFSGCPPVDGGDSHVAALP
jgi:3D (Asp-Asp-Asp) domain-containing protein